MDQIGCREDAYARRIQSKYFESKYPVNRFLFRHGFTIFVHRGMFRIHVGCSWITAGDRQ